MRVIMKRIREGYYEKRYLEHKEEVMLNIQVIERHQFGGTVLSCIGGIQLKLKIVSVGISRKLLT